MPTMPKNIAICSDGTGNTEIKGRGTNVFKLYEAVDLEGHKTNAALTPQIAFYDDGVGTGRFKVWRLLSGAFGWGLGRNVRRLYADLARTYNPGDQIFLFGFSRGAFTVRTLADFIATCGIVDRKGCPTDDDLREAVHKVYRAYRDYYQTALGRFLRWCLRCIFRRGAAPDVPPGVEAARQQAVRHPKVTPPATEKWQVPIQFIGVWDTVDAVGLPIAGLAEIINSTVYRFKFTNYQLSQLVHRGRHAIAIDDERHTFHPVLWDEAGEPHGRIEQVWFAGVHSNVGGGYPKQGMSLVTLVWMMKEAKLAGLRFCDLDWQLYHERQNIYDKLYDSRAGPAFFYRYKPRDIGEMCTKHGMPSRIHTSAIERIVQGPEGYFPGNIPGKSEVVGQPRDPQVDVGNVVQQMKQEIGGVRSPLDWALVRWAVRVRRASQFVVIILSLLVVFMALWSGVRAKGWWGALRALGSLSGALELVWTFVVEAIRGALWWVVALLVVMVLAYVIGLLASWIIRNVFSDFWSRVVR